MIDSAAARAQGKTAVVVQHLSLEDLGSFGPVLADHGWQVRYRQAGMGPLADDLSSADLAVVLGGPIGVYEEADYPFLAEETAALRERLARGRPTLGVCLGAQLIAKALGARVYAGGRKEIGWSTLTLSEAGQASPLRHLAGTPVLHWHGDTFDLPEGAVLLASSEVYPHQAFSVGRHVLALQCHPEAQADSFERWLIGHTGELRGAAIDIPALRAQGARLAPALEEANARLLADWLAQLA